MSVATASNSILRGLNAELDDLEALHKDIPSHPGLSMPEKRTAGLAAERLRAAKFEVTEGVGETGVVGVLKNGDGPTVMLRADMDALPVKEATGLPYASTVTAIDADGNETPVMHACGHDIHVTWLAGASRVIDRHHTAPAVPTCWRPMWRVARHCLDYFSAEQTLAAMRSPRVGLRDWLARPNRNIRAINPRVGRGSTRSAMESAR